MTNTERAAQIASQIVVGSVIRLAKTSSRYPRGGNVMELTIERITDKAIFTTGCIAPTAKRSLFHYEIVR